MALAEAFTTWFLSKGGEIHPAVEFAWSPTDGFYLRMKQATQLATSRLPKNTTIVSCPHSLSLSALNALPLPSLGRVPDRGEEDSGLQDAHELKLPEEICKTARPQCLAACWLCVQFLLRERSPWYGYICVLPRPPRLAGDAVIDGAVQDGVDGVGVIDTAVWWTDEQTAWVEGTNLASGIRSLELVWKQEWEAVGHVVVEWADTHGLFGWDWRLFKWAVSIFGSRAFSSAVLSFATDGDSKTPILGVYNPHALLYPGVDMLNHSNETQNGWFCNEKCFSLVCNDEPSPGEQIFNSYGMKDNGSLLLSFGFALLGNARDAFAVKLPKTKNAILEAIRESEPPKQEEYRSAASILRFAAAEDVNTDPEVPTTPGQTIILNETESLLSHDPDHNVFYIRSPQQLLSLVIARAFKPNPGYPNLSQALPYDDHLYGFPSALLEELATKEANEREIAQVMSDPSNSSGKELWTRLGERNETALSILLLERLRLEASRIITLGLDVAANPSPVEYSIDLEAQTEKALPASAMSISNQRYQQAGIYAHSQLKILFDNIKPLRRRIFTALIGEHLPKDIADQPANPALFDILKRTEASTTMNTVANEEFSAEKGLGRPAKRARIGIQEDLHIAESASGSRHAEALLQEPISQIQACGGLQEPKIQLRGGKELFTLHRAVELLQLLSPAIATEFMSGVLALAMADLDEDKLRHRLCPDLEFKKYIDEVRNEHTLNTEEDVFALWILAVYILYYELEPTLTEDGLPRRLLEELCGFWKDWYGLEFSDHQNGSQQKSNEDNIWEVYYHLTGRDGKLDLEVVRKTLPWSKLWASPSWDRTSEVTAAIEQIVEGETVGLFLNRQEHKVLQRIENGESKTLDGLDNVPPVAPDVPPVDFRATALYLPLKEQPLR